MNANDPRPKDWFDWAESFLAEWKMREAEVSSDLSPRAEHVLELATQAALSLGHNAVGAEHLLAGVLKLNSGAAAGALNAAGITLSLLRAEIEAVWGIRGPGEVDHPMPRTPRCKRIVLRARARAHFMGRRVEPECLLLALLAENGGLCDQMFRKRGIDVEMLKFAAELGTGRQ